MASLLIAGIVVVSAFIFGKLVDNLNRKKLNEKIQKIELKKQTATKTQ